MSKLISWSLGYSSEALQNSTQLKNSNLQEIMCTPPVQCNQEQRLSGGSETVTKLFEIPKGVNRRVSLKFEFYSIPDSIEFWYDKRQHFAVGPISGSGQQEFNLPDSTDFVEVKLTGNQDSSTKWWYVISCKSTTAEPLVTSVDVGTVNNYLYAERVPVRISFDSSSGDMSSLKDICIVEYLEPVDPQGNPIPEKLLYPYPFPFADNPPAYWGTWGMPGIMCSWQTAKQKAGKPMERGGITYRPNAPRLVGGGEPHFLDGHGVHAKVTENKQEILNQLQLMLPPSKTPSSIAVLPHYQAHEIYYKQKYYWYHNSNNSERKELKNKNGQIVTKLLKRGIEYEDKDICANIRCIEIITTRTFYEYVEVTEITGGTRRLLGKKRVKELGVVSLPKGSP